MRVVILAVALALAATGCGRKGDPLPPEGANPEAPTPNPDGVRRPVTVTPSGG